MIAHLHDREKSLEPFGWTGREAEWIALVCLHSGVFTRAQFCHFLDRGREESGASLCPLAGGARHGRGVRSTKKARRRESLPDFS